MPAELNDAAVAGFVIGEISSSIAKHRLLFNSSSSKCSQVPPIEMRPTGSTAHVGSARFSQELVTAEEGSRKSSLKSNPRIIAKSEVSLIDIAMIEEFFNAVADGDSDLVDELIGRGVPVDSEDEEGNTALLYAAEGEPKLVESLLKAGCDVNHQNNEGLTALMRAVAYEDEAIIKHLLAAGASMDLCDKSGRKAEDHATNADVRRALGLREHELARKMKRAVDGSAATDPAGRRASVTNVDKEVARLFDAVSNGDIDLVKDILDSGVAVDSRDNDGNTPLIIAAESEPGMVEQLLERGANVDQQNRNGVTAMIAAVKCEDTSIVAMLILAGATLELRDRKGRSAADFAKECDKSVQQEILHLLNDKEQDGHQKRGMHCRRRRSMVNVDAQTRGMLMAVSEGDLPKVSQVLSEGCAVDVQDDELNTALMFAAESEPLIVELLLESGADPDRQNASGATALMYAIRAEDMDSIRLLMQHNASTSIRSRDGRTPIDIARQTGSEAIMRLVLGLSDGLALRAKAQPSLPMEVMRRGSLPSCSSADRRTRAFFEAISEGDLERVERILQMAFDVNCTDDTQCRPLHFAVEGEADLVTMLIDHGADVNAANEAGETPLMAAVRFCDVECTTILLQSGASCSSRDKAGRSVEDYAKASKSSLIQNLVREAMR